MKALDVLAALDTIQEKDEMKTITISFAGNKENVNLEAMENSVRTELTSPVKTMKRDVENGQLILTVIADGSLDLKAEIETVLKEFGAKATIA